MRIRRPKRRVEDVIPPLASRPAPAPPTRSPSSADAPMLSDGCRRPGTATPHRAHRPRRPAGTAPAPPPRAFATDANKPANCVGILTPVVRRHLHADHHHLGPRGLGRLRHGGQVVAGHRQRQAAQGVVAAEFEHHQAGLYWASSAGRRVRPPDVVSPLMLALTARAAIFSWASRARAARPSRCRVPIRTRPRGCRRRPARPAPSRRPTRPAASRARPPRTAAVQCASQRRRVDPPRDTASDMSEPIIAVERVTKQSAATRPAR